MRRFAHRAFSTFFALMAAFPVWAGQACVENNSNLHIAVTSTPNTVYDFNYYVAPGKTVCKHQGLLNSAPKAYLVTAMVFPNAAAAKGFAEERDSFWRKALDSWADTSSDMVDKAKRTLQKAECSDNDRAFLKGYIKGIKARGANIDDICKGNLPSGVERGYLRLLGLRKTTRYSYSHCQEVIMASGGRLRINADEGCSYRLDASARYQPTPVLYGAPACTIYEHSRYRGISKSFDDADSVRNIGDQFNDLISSVTTAKGCTLTGWQHVNFKGAKRDFSGHTGYVGDTFNDSLSSLTCSCDMADSSDLAEYLNTAVRNRDTYEWREGHYIKGHTVGSLGNASLFACMQACDEYDLCKSFDYDRHTQRCWMNGLGESAQATPSGLIKRDLFINKKRLAMTPEQELEIVREEVQTRFVMAPLYAIDPPYFKTVKQVSLLGCANSCEREETCKSFNFNPFSRLCELSVNGSSSGKVFHASKGTHEDRYSTSTFFKK